MKRLWIIALLVLSLAACSERAEREEGVSVTFPYFYFADLPIGEIQEDFDHEAFTSIRRNEDRRVVFTMPEERRAQLEETTLHNMEQFMQMEGVSESIQTIEANATYTEFRIVVDEPKYERFQEENLLFVLLEDSVLHHVYKGTDPDELFIEATVYNERGEVIQQLQFTDRPDVS